MVTTEINCTVEERQLFWSHSQGNIESLKCGINPRCQSDAVAKEAIAIQPDAVILNSCWHVSVTNQVPAASLDRTTDTDLMERVSEIALLVSVVVVPKPDCNIGTSGVN